MQNDVEQTPSFAHPTRARSEFTPKALHGFREILPGCTPESKEVESDFPRLNPGLFQTRCIKAWVVCLVFERGEPLAGLPTIQINLDPVGMCTSLLCFYLATCSRALKGRAKLTLNWSANTNVTPNWGLFLCFSEWKLESGTPKRWFWGFEARLLFQTKTSKPAFSVAGG